MNAFRKLVGHRVVSFAQRTAGERKLNNDLDLLLVRQFISLAHLDPVALLILALKGHVRDMSGQRLVPGRIGIGQQSDLIPCFAVPDSPDDDARGFLGAGLISGVVLHFNALVRLLAALRRIGSGQVDHAGHIGAGQRNFGHFAVHVAGDDGQVACLVRVGHDAHRLGGHSALFRLRGFRSGRVHAQQGNVGIGRIVRDRRLLRGCHRLGGCSVIEHDIAGQNLLHIGSILQPVGAAQVAAQSLRSGALGHHGLRHARVVQAVRQEHHVPCAVRVAVPLAVAAVVAHGHTVIGVKLEIFLALLIAQLTLCHGEQVFVPHAGQGRAGLVQPVGFIFKAIQRIGQAVYCVMMLFQAADGVGGVVRRIAGVGVVVHGAFGHRRDHNRPCSCHRGLEHGHGVVIRVQLFDQLAFFKAANQLLLGLVLDGIAAVVVGMFKFVADQAAVLGVEAVIRMDMLFFKAGEHRHFGGHFFVAVGGVLMRHPDVLRLCRLQRDFRLRIHAEAIIGDGVRIRLADRPVLRLTFFIAADKHLGVAVGCMGVLFQPALVVGGLRNTVAVQLPVDEQSRHHRQRQQQRHIPVCNAAFPAEFFRQSRYNILHRF